jgi:hypothetical protein
MLRRWVLRALVFLSSAPAGALADSLNCAGGIVSVGDSRLDLLGKCGPPTLQEYEETVPNSLRGVTDVLERWTYDFGPQRFLQIVTMKGGRVVAVERGGYGYESPAPSSKQEPLPRARCSHDAFRLGDRTLDVLARCGEPAFKESETRQSHTVEVWVYNFGPQQFVRNLEFSGGKLIRIRTAGYGY